MIQGVEVDAHACLLAHNEVYWGAMCCVLTILAMFNELDKTHASVTKVIADAK